MSQLTSKYIGKWFSIKNISMEQMTRLGCLLFFLWCVASVFRVMAAVIETGENSSVIPMTNLNDEKLATAMPERLSSQEIEQIKKIHLFGSPLIGSKNEISKSIEVSQEELNAKATKLDLKLLGVMYSDRQQQAMAIISYKRKQEHYLVDSPLPVQGQVELVRIFEDKVIISNNGRFESLWLYEGDESGEGLITATAKKNNSLLDSTNTDEPVTSKAVANDIHQTIYKNPETLKNAIRAEPANKNGEMIGYRVSPGKKPKAFALLGFKPNDIITHVNDIQLNEPKKVLQLYRLMETAEGANLMIERDNEQIELRLNFERGNS